MIRTGVIAGLAAFVVYAAGFPGLPSFLTGVVVAGICAWTLRRGGDDPR